MRSDSTGVVGPRCYVNTVHRGVHLPLTSSSTSPRPALTRAAAHDRKDDMNTQPEPQPEWIPPTPGAKARLHEHISSALYASAGRVVAQHPQLADQVATWIETAHEKVRVVANVERRARGRIDTRALRLDCYLDTADGLAPLCTVRVRDLIDDDGQPIDARDTARTLLLQHGHGIPDDVRQLAEGA